MVEGDTIRLAGACILSIATSSLVLIVPLLPCCYLGKRNADVTRSIDTNKMDGHFCTRTLFFLQATMGLGFVGVGLVNLVVAEDDGAYDHRCSSLKDQTILWMGVVVVCSSSLGLMTSFWPESKPSTDDATQIEMPRRSICCCCKNGRRTYPSLLEESAVEPLLSDEEGQLAVFDDDNQSTVSNGEDEQQPVVNREKATEPSSRIRGTSRLLKLAGKQSLYLWVGIVVLLIRLPFSLAIPHFVSTTIGSLINADYDGAKRSVLMLFLLGTIDSILDFWCIFLFGYAKENIVKGVRIDTFASIVRQEQAFFDQSNTGDLISRLTSDCGEMAGDLTWFFRFSVEAAVRITGISTYMILRSPFLGLCTVGIVPVVGVINKLYGDWLAKNAQAVQNSLAEATTSAHESLACIQTVITSASEEHECEKYTKKVNTMYALNIRQMIATGIYFMVVSTFLINTCVQAALLLLGSHFVQQGKLTPEVLLAFMLYQGQLQVSRESSRLAHIIATSYHTHFDAFSPSDAGIYVEFIPIIFISNKELRSRRQSVLSSRPTPASSRHRKRIGQEFRIGNRRSNNRWRHYTSRRYICLSYAAGNDGSEPLLS